MKQFAIACIITYFALVSASHAAPVYCAANGHWYEVINDAKTWTDAKTAAASMTFMSITGHLVTITDAAEQSCYEAALDLAATENHVWIGGVQTGGPEPAGGWGWDTAEPWIYTNWRGGEPNNLGGEDHLFTFGNGHADEGLWADGNNAQPRYYAVEYDVPPVAVTPRPWGLVKKLYDQE